MTAQALTLPRYRRGEQIHYERQKTRKTAELIAEIFAAKRAVDDAMAEFCEEFPGLIWEEFCRDGGLI